MKDKITARVDELRDAILATNRYLHDHPELSNEEFESSRRLANLARSHGFTVEMGVAGLPTAFIARKACGKPGKRVAFLAEYDALPVVGHGCGHNMIGTVGTFAAIALASIADQLSGEILLYGTPAEETDGGKIIMLEAGAFDGVDAAMMMHPGCDTEVAYSSLACMSTLVEFFGKSAHAAASPEKGINALDAMIQLFVSIDLLLKQIPRTARCPGVILKGGERANMVPDYTKAQFSVRGKDMAEAEYVQSRLIDCARAAATATGVRMEHQTDGHPYFEMRPDPQLAAWFRENWLAVDGEEPISTPRQHGSLDIGNLSHRFPCLHPSFRITENERVAGHTHDFAAATVTNFAEEQLVKAVKAIACTGSTLLQ